MPALSPCAMLRTGKHVRRIIIRLSTARSRYQASSRYQMTLKCIHKRCALECGYGIRGGNIIPSKIFGGHPGHELKSAMLDHSSAQLGLGMS
jgi:hypothetical protein